MAALVRQVLWEYRCRAVVQRQRFRPLFLMLRTLREKMANHLENQLWTLGEQEFLRRWHSRFLLVSENRVILRPTSVLH